MFDKVNVKEKTLRLYKEPMIRLQMVQLDCYYNSIHLVAPGSSSYEIRENRKLLLRTNFYDEACKYFKSRVYSYVSQISLC